MSKFKSKQAFLCSTDRLSKSENTINTKAKLYFWTFTLKNTVSYKQFRKDWNSLATIIKRECPGFRGLRVFEVHPGKEVYDISSHSVVETSHGLHVHVLTDCPH